MSSKRGASNGSWQSKATLKQRAMSIGVERMEWKNHEKQDDWNAKLGDCIDTEVVWEVEELLMEL